MKGVDLAVVLSVAIEATTIQITIDDGWSSWPCVAAIDGEGIGAAAARALALVPCRWDEAMIVAWSGTTTVGELAEITQAIVAWRGRGA